MNKHQALKFWLDTVHALTRQRHNAHPSNEAQTAIVTTLALAESRAWAMYTATPSDLDGHEVCQ
jgi:hypothetical protein